MKYRKVKKTYVHHKSFNLLSFCSLLSLNIHVIFTRISTGFEFLVACLNFRSLETDLKQALSLKMRLFS